VDPREAWVATDGGRLLCREIGAGRPIVVLHGGPEFDHTYLLPELDRLADAFRLLYYDQRGRGRSAGGVRPDDVTLRSEMDDLERVRSHFRLESIAVLGHSWGGVLAMEYALRHPDRVSHVILMDTAPASASDWRILREELARGRAPGDLEAMVEIAATEAFGRGDLEAEAAYNRIHFRMTVTRPELLEALVARLRANFTEKSVLLARAIDLRLRDETALAEDWDLFPALRGLHIPTLVLHGEHDFIPLELAARIAETVPGARLSVLPGCGHFAYLEAPDLVLDEVARLFDG
jgi:proline iminopeptidase